MVHPIPNNSKLASSYSSFWANLAGCHLCITWGTATVTVRGDYCPKPDLKIGPPKKPRKKKKPHCMKAYGSRLAYPPASWLQTPSMCCILPQSHNLSVFPIVTIRRTFALKQTQPSRCNTIVWSSLAPTVLSQAYYRRLHRMILKAGGCCGAGRAVGTPLV